MAWVRLEACGARGSSVIRPRDYRAWRTKRERRSCGFHLAVRIPCDCYGWPAVNIDSFAIGFDHRDRVRLHALWESALDAEQWSEGRITRQFEDSWAAWNGLPAVATGNWTGAALAALDFLDVRGRTVLCPSNTFMATPLAVQAAGGRVEFVDCNRHDLCMSFDDFERKVHEHKPHAVFLVHIGGHIAFDVEQIAAYCRSEGIVLIEDCAHAHGASGTAAVRAPGATPGSGRSPPRRRSRPARAACSSRRTTS